MTVFADFKPNNLQEAVNLANHGKALTLTPHSRLCGIYLIKRQKMIKKNVDVDVIVIQEGDHGNSIPTRLAFCS